MSEFLIKKVDATHPDSVKDQRGCYKRGDIVQIYNDGECKEPPSPNSKMLLVKVPEMSKEENKRYVEEHIEPRVRTEKWSITDWSEMVKEERYQNFLSKPEVMSEYTEPIKMEVSLLQWMKMQEKNDYAPFEEKPVNKYTSDYKHIKLFGDVHFVDLQGNVNTTITRRLYSFDLSAIEFGSERQVTITATQAKMLLRKKV